MSEIRPLARRNMLGWAVGDFGFNIFWQTLNLLLLPFYTDVLGLNAALAGTVFLIASLWDGFADTVIGAIADRTRSRWGSYRPYLIFASPVLVVSFILAFLTPDWEQEGLFLYALLSQIFLRTAYSLVSIPYSSLSARISQDSGERSSMAGWRMFFAFSGGAFVTFVMPQLVQTLGEETQSTTYVLAAGLTGLISLPFFWIVFANTSEPERLRDANPSGFSMAASVEDFRATVRMAMANGPLVRIFGCIIVSSLAFTMTNKCLVYYVTYYLERPDLVPRIVPFALVIHGALLGVLLIWIGYTPNVAQSEETLWGLKAIMALIPLTGVLLSGWLIWGYPLTRDNHRAIVEGTYNERR